MKNSTSKLSLVPAIAWALASAGAQAFASASDPPKASTPATTPANPIPKPLEGSVDLKPKQTAKELFDKNYTAETSLNFSSVSDEAISNLDKLLEMGVLDQLNQFVSRHQRDPKIVRWLSTKSKEGHVNLMWTMADYYAKTNNVEMAVKWSYAAMFGTLQESKLCLDKSAQNAAASISAANPLLLRMTRSNPDLLKTSKIFAMDVLINATSYGHPTPWLCKPYAPAEKRKSKASTPYSYDAIYFPFLRARARNELRQSYRIDQALEPLPPLPQALPQKQAENSGKTP